MAPTTLSRTAKLAVNSRGLPALPNELYLEIFSHMPALSIPQDIWLGFNKPDPHRQLALYSLSQTNRSLREFFLPYAWERIEVFGGMWTPKGRLLTSAEYFGIDDKMAVEILRQLRTVTVRNPHLRQYVSILDLKVPIYFEDLFLPEIAQKMSLLPNMHTIQLDFLYFPYDAKPVFSKFRYLKVHTLNIRGRFAREELLRACPNTKNFLLYNDFAHGWEVFRGMECATKIERLDLPIWPQQSIFDVVNVLPRLSDITLGYKCLGHIKPDHVVKVLSSLPLHTIRLRLDRFKQLTPQERLSWLEMAKTILTKCQKTEMAKKIVVVNADTTLETHHIWNCTSIDSCPLHSC